MTNKICEHKNRENCNVLSSEICVSIADGRHFDVFVEAPTDKENKQQLSNTYRATEQFKIWTAVKDGQKSVLYCTVFIK